MVPVKEFPVFGLINILQDGCTTYTTKGDMGCFGSLAINKDVQIALAPSVLLATYPDVQWLSCMVILFLTFEGASVPFSHWLHHLVKL